MQMMGLDPNETYIGSASEEEMFPGFSDDDIEFLNKLRAMPPAGLGQGKNNCPPKGGVYVLIDPASNIIMRSGHTSNLETREGQHGRDSRFKDYDFETVYRTDNYSEQRGLEQIVHLRATAAQGFPPPFNYNQPIAAGNPNYMNYMNSAQGYIKNLQ
jgi:hypothetical protein